jgi:predicted DNA-binding antitoxin AbrB/MazE fold protein
MMRTVEAIYQNGVLKPVESLDLDEQARVKLVLLPVEVGEDIPTEALHELAAQSGSFDFLADPREDVYSLEDGEPV